MKFQSCWQPSNFNIFFFLPLKKAKGEVRLGREGVKTEAGSDTLFLPRLLRNANLGMGHFKMPLLRWKMPYLVIIVNLLLI